MPVKPSPLKITCKACGWSTVTHNKSDCIVVPPPKKCERCGRSGLVLTRAGLLDVCLHLFAR